MGAACDDAVQQLARLLDQVEEPLKKTFQVCWIFLLSVLQLLYACLCSTLFSA
uniref:Uncharacterized protein n=1 Tax=Aegilops tauschii subsp. strangulata TaxID=200361 RepID=A0A453SFR4_AEGTS